MKRFLDTNILVYAHGAHCHAAAAQDIVAGGGEISVQVLNEFVHVLRRKLRRNWEDIESALADLSIVLPPPRPITHATHIEAVSISRDLRYGFYDALILASALEAGCQELITEDMQHGQVIGNLTIRNPFLALS